VAGVGLAFDTRTAYVSIVLGDSATFLVSALILSRLASIPPTPAPETGPRLVAVRDRPFLAFVVLDGLMATHFGLFDVALPLWISQRTDAPQWMIAVLLLVNTAAVVLFQVRAARGTDELSGAARASRQAGVALAGRLRARVRPSTSAASCGTPPAGGASRSASHPPARRAVSGDARDERAARGSAGAARGHGPGAGLRRPAPAGPGVSSSGRARSPR
jgi:hypothetical protein